MIIIIFPNSEPSYNPEVVGTYVAQVRYSKYKNIIPLFIIISLIQQCRTFSLYFYLGPKAIELPFERVE